MANHPCHRIAVTLGSAKAEKTRWSRPPVIADVRLLCISLGSAKDTV